MIIAPMTIKSRAYPTRIPGQFQGKEGQIILDQIRTVDKTRLVKKLGQIQPDEQKLVLEILAEMFAEQITEPMQVAIVINADNPD